MELIDKSSIVAEIERIKEDTGAGLCAYDMGEENGKLQVCDKLLSFIDTLEVKEVEKGTMSDNLKDAIGQSFIYHESHGDDFRSDKQIETAYICGFKTGAKWADEHSIEVKEVDLNKEIKDYFDNLPIITRSKSVDYQLIPSAEDIAKHFFNLGLKAREGKE